MFDNEIVSPNEKIKKIRKQILRVTQEELAQGICTKNNLSQIENNKQKLTYNLAVGLANNSNKIAEDKNIEIEKITAEWLIKDEDSQANDIFERNILKDLNRIEIIDQYENKLLEAENLLKNCNVSDDLKIKLYKSASLFYYSKGIYSKSDEMCNIGLKICLRFQNNLEEAHFYVTKARNNLTQNEYKHALQQLDYAEKINEKENNGEIYDRIYFNKALVYKKMKEYNLAIKCLKFLKDKYEGTNQRKLLDIKMLYANCLNELSEFKKAEKEYISILEPAMKIDDKDFIALTYRNLSELYDNQTENKNAAEAIKESLKHNPGNLHLNRDLYFAAKILEKINVDIEPYLLQALEFSEKKDKENFNLIEKIIYKLLLIYMNEENEKGIDSIIDKTQRLNIKYDLIFPQLVEYYRHRNERKSIEINEKLINKSKQIKDV